MATARTTDLYSIGVDFDAIFAHCKGPIGIAKTSTSNNKSNPKVDKFHKILDEIVDEVKVKAAKEIKKSNDKIKVAVEDVITSMGIDLKDKSVEDVIKSETTKVETTVDVEPENYEFKVKVDEAETMELIKPFTFSKLIDENGQVIVESENVDNMETVAAETAVQTQEAAETTQVETESAEDLSNPFKDALKKEKDEIINVINSGVKPTTYVNNSILIASYPALKNIELSIRELGLDCMFIQRPDKLIAVGIIANGKPMPLSGFMIDLDDVVIGKDPKWFNTFIDQNTDASALEKYFAIRIYNSDLLIKYIKGEATIEEFKRSAIYNSKYIAVNSVVDLRSLPKNLNNNLTDQIITRLYKGMKAGVFNGINCTEKFKIENYTSPASYTLRSGDTTIIVERESIKVNA